MSDITTNNNGSQDDNQKTTPVTESLFKLNNSSTISLGGIFHTWLGLRHGNITFSDNLDFDPAELDIVYQDPEELS